MYSLQTGKFLIILFTCVLVLTSIVGLIVYGSYTKLRGPVWFRNQFIGAWTSLILLFFSLQTFYLFSKKSYRFKKPYFFLDLFYYILIIASSALSTVCYSLTNRIDTVIFCSLITLICVINSFILINRRNPVKKPQQNYIPTIDQDIENVKNDMFINEKDPCLKTYARFLNVLFKLFFLAITVLIANGSVLNGLGKLKYIPRGKLVQVALSDNSSRSINIHYLCDGPVDSQYPTIMLESDNLNNHLNFLKLQSLLKKENRRSCIWDKAGLGHSDYLYSDMFTHDLYYHNFLNLLNETKPYIFIGLGAGGRLVYDYANKHPDMVHSITLIDSTPVKVEWKMYAKLRNWTLDKMNEKIRNDINNKLNSIFLINAISVPFGLIPFFNSYGSMHPLKVMNENLWFLSTEKRWLSEQNYWEQLDKEIDVFKQHSLNENVTVNHIMSIKSNEQISKQVCKEKKLDDGSIGCLYEKEANKFFENEKKQLTKTSLNGKIYVCNYDECNLDYFVNTQPQFTLKALIELYP